MIRVAAILIVVAAAVLTIATAATHYFGVLYSNSASGDQWLLQNGRLQIFHWTGVARNGRWGIDEPDGFSIRPHNIWHPGTLNFGSRRAVATVSLGFAAFILWLASAGMILYGWTRRRSRQRAQRCGSCGYSLAGLTSCTPCP